jgi:hypothetical protein
MPHPSHIQVGHFVEAYFSLYLDLQVKSLDFVTILYHVYKLHIF